MSILRLILFDVDGVLLDSLIPHLKICEDKNIEFNLGLTIPRPFELKAMARRGVPISPMKDFFMAVGFSEPMAKKANGHYDLEFTKKYAPSPFPLIGPMLSELHQHGLRIGIVTSNVRLNSVEALGLNMGYFDPHLIFTKDDPRFVSKAQAIIDATKLAQIAPEETLYVGDQLADWQAAKAAKVNFLGVSYGWGITEEDLEFPVARDIPEITSYILKCLTSSK